MKFRKQPGAQKNHIANKLFREEIRRAVKNESMKGVEEKYGVSGDFVFYLKRDERGVSLPAAVELANRLGIDLGKIQRACA